MQQVVSSSFLSASPMSAEASVDIIQLKPVLSPGWSLWLQRCFKRIFDFAASMALLLILFPVLVVIAWLIHQTSPGPVIYKSLRVGQHGKLFYMYKFRTMNNNADAMRDSLRQKSNLQGNLFKLPDDPRVTPVGKWLRAWSLDELPQLWNVLLGHMSLVGPRPLPPDESRLFRFPYDIRFLVAPGITGLWQVSGRSRLNFQQLCQLEFQYVSCWSFWSDFRILAKTIPVVLKTEGAY